ncbi:4Fe-4S binding protein [bacterium]|nr:4Fe-4S binding protein [bacterium]
MTKRTRFQAVATLLTNGYLKGFFTGSIFTGVSKNVCVPTLNCYSCPGALFACPVGAVQVILAGGGGLDITATQTFFEKVLSITSGVPFFVVGFLTLVGSFVGRATCGWICPFGWFQDILYRIPAPKLSAPKKLNYLKFVLLITTVVLFPLLYVNQQGIHDPTYCKYVCPAGTLEGGVLLPLMNQDLRKSLGALYAWKVFMLFFFMVCMTAFRRPFCRWACPLGAFLGLFNKVSYWKLELDSKRCVACEACRKACPIALDVTEEIDGLDCIRCLECTHVCPKGIIQVSNLS